MMEYEFLVNPTRDQIRQILLLYEAAGWWRPGPEAPEALRRLMAGSHCFLVANCGGELVGMGRAISDSASDAYIQDVTVRSDCRGQGIGSRIVAGLVARLKTDGIAWVGLIAERNSHGLYGKLGFSQMIDSVPMLLNNPE